MNKSQNQKNRKGSHVGVVLSFIIFITFLIFLYPLLIKPLIETNKGSQYLLDDLEANINQEVSAELTISSIEVNEGINQNCIELQNFINATEINSNIIVKNHRGLIQQGDVSGNSLIINRNDNNDVFFKVSYSNEFKVLNDITSNCKLIQENDYKIGLIRTEKYVFETKIINLTKEYESNYESLKKRLELPARNEFDFSFIYDDKTSIGTKKEVSTSIYAEEIPVQYVNKKGDILLGDLNIRVW